MSNIEHPIHYNKNDRKECIVEMQELYGLRFTIDFCIGNCYKYLYRRGSKENNSYEQDTKKALWYLNYAKKMVDENNISNIWYAKEFEDLERIMERETND